jgi:(2R)-3-sulfolactate dehydrogenase (NADP+)
LQSGATSRSIRDAEADGIRNVGLAYLPTYCAHLRCDKVVGDAVPEVVAVDGATVHVDAHDGFCHPAFEAGLGTLVDLARAHGVGLLTIGRSSSAGVLGWMVERLADDGLVGLGAANSSPLVAPWGGRTPMLGTNPLAFAVPRPGVAPLVIDLATSATAWVNIKDAADRGQPIPLGWGLDSDGRPTADAGRALDGSVAPLGGAKGFALGLVVELLAGGLSASNWGIDASSFGDDLGGPVGVGQTFIAVRPRPSAADFGIRVERLLGALLAEEGVRLPGARRLECRQRAAAEGVDVPDALLDELRTVRRGR